MKFCKLVVSGVHSLGFVREIADLSQSSRVYWQYWRYQIDSAVEWPVDRAQGWTATAIQQGAGSTQ
jgi:hypothetical protein